MTTYKEIADRAREGGAEAEAITQARVDNGEIDETPLLCDEYSLAARLVNTYEIQTAKLLLQGRLDVEIAEHNVGGMGLTIRRWLKKNNYVKQTP